MGNAFGLANTLSQSLLFKPSMESRAANVAFAGHLAHPGPGVPPAMISGLVSANVLDARLAGRDVPLSVDSSLSAFLDDAPIASDAAAAGWLNGAVSALLAQSSRVGVAWWALARSVLFLLISVAMVHTPLSEAAAVLCIAIVFTALALMFMVAFAVCDMTASSAAFVPLALRVFFVSNHALTTPHMILVEFLAFAERAGVKAYGRSAIDPAAKRK